MKKRMLTALLAAVLVCSLAGVAQAQSPEVLDAQETPVAELPLMIPGDAPAQVTADDVTTPALHGMLLAMLHYGHTQFDRDNPVVCWEALYNVLSLYGQTDERSEYIGEELLIPAETAADFAAALVGNLDELGKLPAELSDRMVYDAAQESYRLVCGNDDLVELVLDSVSPTAVDGRLVSLPDDAVLAAFHATLQPADNLFGYVITALELV